MKNRLSIEKVQMTELQNSDMIPRSDTTIQWISCEPSLRLKTRKYHRQRESVITCSTVTKEKMSTRLVDHLKTEEQHSSNDKFLV